MDIVWFLLIGVAAGWLASQIMKGGGSGLVTDLIMGVIGAILGGFLFGLLGLSAEHPEAERRKRDQPGDEFHAAGKLRQRRRPDRGPERREEQQADRVHALQV